MKTIKKYLALDYLYFGTPFLLSLTYLACVLKYTTFQIMINSLYSNIFNLIVSAIACVAIPNFAKLVFYTKKTLHVPETVCMQAAASEKFGGAGEGKTSSAVLQAVFEAESLQSSTESTYHYMLANRQRWQKKAPWKMKNFDQIERSVKFWNEHSEFIPYLVSTVEIRLPDGRRSLLVTRDHIDQQKWLPISFLCIDEAGTILPQDEWKDRPADCVLFFRFIRHFGFKATLCEQKKDGILINVRSVLGGTVLCMGQHNDLQAHLLYDIVAFLKRRLSKARHKASLGRIIERLDIFSRCIGFRIWDQLYFKTMEFTQYKPPVGIQIVCTNKMPCDYDDTAFADLYLAKDAEEKVVVSDNGVVSADSEMGKALLKTHFEQEEKYKVQALKEEKELLALQVKISELKKKQESGQNVDAS